MPLTTETVKIAYLSELFDRLDCEEQNRVWSSINISDGVHCAHLLVEASEVIDLVNEAFDYVEEDYSPRVKEVLDILRESQGKILFDVGD